MEHWIERADGPPPPYPTTSAPPTALPTAGTPDPLSQFRRYIIEIMAFTFDADFAKLNQALDQTPSPMNPKSILRAEEHDKLLALAMLVKEMLPKVSEGSTHQLTVRAGDRKTIADAIIRPALFLGIPAVYTLKIIRSYSAHRCDPSKRSLSSISEEKPWGFNFWLSLRWLTPLNIILWGFEQDLWSHARIVELAIPEEEVRMVLGEAVNVYQRKELGTTSISSFVPMSFFEPPSYLTIIRAFVSAEEEASIQREKRD